MKQIVRVKKLHEQATVPSYGSMMAAGADLYALVEDGSLTVAPHATVLVRTGLAMEIPEGFAGLIYARSGIACKRHLAPANKVGVIDSDYRGEILVALHNHGETSQSIEHGERIAQMIITPFITADFTECDTLDDTDRGEGGFGSTGKH